MTGGVLSARGVVPNHRLRAIIEDLGKYK